MKFFFKLLIKAGVTLGIVFFGYKFILSGDSGFKLPWVSDVADEASKGINELGNAIVKKDVTVYQWVDANGITQFGGTPPTGQGEYNKKQIRASTNVMQAFQSPSKEAEEPKQKSRVARVGSVYSPEGVKNMMDDAGNVTEQMNERMAEQEKLLNELMNQQKGTKKR